MQLSIKPHAKNNYTIGGLLIHHPSAKVWIQELQLLQFTLNEIAIYPVPGAEPNTIWGCFVLLYNPDIKREYGQHQLCQQVSPYLFIPERAQLFPPLTNNELKQLFQNHIHLMHPDFGLVELKETLNLQALLTTPVLKSYYVNKPQPSVFIPTQVNSFQVKPLTPEELLKKMEEEFPKTEKLKDEPLTNWENFKLKLYKNLFGSSDAKEKKGDGTEKPGLGERLLGLLNLDKGKTPKWVERMQNDFEDLERRNKKELDKLLDLFKNNLEEALKYAIPLDDNGSSRGGEQSTLDLKRRWDGFSLHGSSGSGGGGSINLGDGYYALRNQYSEAAKKLIAEGEFHKAAFIYMKLLKEPYNAAQTLESGGFYQEAAEIYMKQCNNQVKAAECFEKGNMLDNAIDLYKEMNYHEKVGDLYLKINKRKEAFTYFEIVADGHKKSNHYMRAASVYKEKMQDGIKSQETLLEGWRANADAENCLSSYLANIPDKKQLKDNITAIYNTELNTVNTSAFINVIKREYQKNDEHSDDIREMAYQLIVSQIKINPSIVSELKHFNIPDKELIKDALRFKQGM